MKNVYILLNYEEENFRGLQVFSTKELAELYKKNHEAEDSSDFSYRIVETFIVEE